MGRRKKNQRKLRKKKQAHERRMSESECSETEERDKYKIVDEDDDDDDDKKGIENVKPILNRDKASAQVQSTNNHETDKSNNDAGKNLASPEFKNDLIFDLDM